MSNMRLIQISPTVLINQGGGNITTVKLYPESQDAEIKIAETVEIRMMDGTFTRNTKDAREIWEFFWEQAHAIKEFKKV